MADHQTIAHRWAQDTGAKLTGYAMFCASGILYSHGRHFPIARWINTPARRGHPSRRVILFNADSYSVSTSKHQSYTRRAIPSGAEVFNIPALSEYEDLAAPVHGKRVLAWHEAEAAKLHKKASRARVNGPWLMRQAEAHLAEAERFALAFGHRWKRPALDDVARIAAARAEATRKAAEKAAKERAKAEAVRLAQQRERDAFAFEAWQSGQPVPCPASYRLAPDGTAYVTRTRFEDGSEELRTSQGASVPWDHAVKAFRFIRLCVEKGETWERNGRTVRVGHYTLDRIDKSGDMTAGCHRFAWDQMRALAEREGVLDLAPSAEAVTVTH
jgi:hypothetical protein